jgi:hypothetical protein
MKKTEIALAFSLLSLAWLPRARGQATPTTFKGNSLGMSLEEFKQANRGQQVWINTGDPNKRQNKKLSRLVDTPLRTDTLDGFEGTAEVAPRKPGEVVCNISSGSFNPDAKVVAGTKMGQIIYRFYGGKLYEIQLQFAAVSFSGVKAAFISKYGPPTNTEQESFQNGFGARWSGEGVEWVIGKTMRVILVEGPGNGPGQDNLSETANATIADSSLAPPTQAPAKTDF